MNNRVVSAIIFIGMIISSSGFAELRGGHASCEALTQKFQDTLSVYLEKSQAYYGAKAHSRDLYREIDVGYPQNLVEQIFNAPTEACYVQLLGLLDQHFEQDPDAVSWVARQAQLEWNNRYFLSFALTHNKETELHHLMLDCGLAAGALLTLHASSPRLTTSLYFSLFKNSSFRKSGSRLALTGSALFASEIPARAMDPIEMIPSPPAAKLKLGSMPLGEQALLNIKDIEFRQKMISEVSGAVTGFSSFIALSRLFLSERGLLQIPLAASGGVGRGVKIGVYIGVAALSFGIDQIVEHQTGVALKKADKLALEREFRGYAQLTAGLSKKRNKALKSLAYRYAHELTQSALKIDAIKNFDLLQSDLEFKLEVSETMHEAERKELAAKFYDRQERAFRSVHRHLDPMILHYVARREFARFRNFTREQVIKELIPILSGNSQIIQARREFLQEFVRTGKGYLGSFLDEQTARDEKALLTEASRGEMDIKSDRFLLQAYVLVKSLRSVQLDLAADEVLLGKLNSTVALLYPDASATTNEDGLP